MATAFPILDAVSPPLPASSAALRDSHGRAITDLRVSVTDRCNYRCVYCRTGNDGAQYSELPIADYARIIRVFVSLGIEKIRLTGGEPLLRKGLVELIEEVSSLGPKLDIALTTNGHLLEDLAAPLHRAGLNRITVSMDAVDPEIFARITRVPGSYERVLRGVNDNQIEAFAHFSREENVIVRFIEFMPLEEDRSWTPEIVVPMDEIVTRLNV